MKTGNVQPNLNYQTAGGIRVSREDVVQTYAKPTEEAGTADRPGDRTLETLSIHVHNLYLQLAASLGLLGLSGFLYWLARTAGLLLRPPPGVPRLGSDPSRAREPGNSRPSPALVVWAWRTAGLGLLAGFLIQNLVDVTFPSLALETGLLIGAACAVLTVGTEVEA